MKECKKRKRIKRIILWFPFIADARMACTSTSLRHMPEIGAFLRPIREKPSTVCDGNRVYGEYNAVYIDYNGRSNVAIAMQDRAQPAAETMIFIKPERISIGERYRIVDENFNERLDRTGVGSTDKKTPDATVHVLIMVDGLFDCIPSLQLNANEKRRFFMEWNDRCEKNGVENAVCVASEYSFTFQQMMKNRPALLNRKLYYMGYEPVEESLADGEISANTERENEPVDDAQAPAVERDGFEAAEQNEIGSPEVVNEAELQRMPMAAIAHAITMAENSTEEAVNDTMAEGNNTGRSERPANWYDTMQRQEFGGEEIHDKVASPMLTDHDEDVIILEEIVVQQDAQVQQ